jgi:DNA-binding GntR family transcriptional regulator
LLYFVKYNNLQPSEIGHIMPTEFVTKKNYVVQRIIELIHSGEITPGTQLNQRELASRLSTSVTPVREALMQLETEGVIQFTPHRGARVTPISPQSARDICLIRSRLEELALDMAFARISPKDIRELEEIQAGIEEALQNRELARVKLLNTSFHKKLISVAGSTALTEVLEQVYRKLPWNALPAQYDGVENTIRDHRVVIEALKAKDLAAAKQSLGQHILAWGEFLFRFLHDNAGTNALDKAPPSPLVPSGQGEQSRDGH